MQMQAHIGLLYFVTEMKLFISIVLALNMFLKKLKNLLGIKANIFRVQANDSEMCGYFCIGFIYFMLLGTKLIDYTSFFSHYDFEKNGYIILDLLQK